VIPTAVVIVNHNTSEELRACLESVAVEAPHETVVCDTGSTDGSQDVVRREFPAVRLLEMENRGYGAGANQGIRAISTPFVLLVNSDTRLTPGCLLALAEYLEAHPRVALAGPRIVDARGVGQKSPRPFPTPATVFVEESGLHRVPLPGLQRRVPDRPAEVECVLGAALALRRVAFDDVGGFDTSFFMYGEEIDLCARLRARGWTVHYAPVGTIVHSGGASTSQRRSAMVVELVRSMRLLYARHLPASKAPQLGLVLAASFGTRLIRDRARLALAVGEERREHLRASMRAWRAGLAALRELRP
jgi:N-acetylglucosaminyl-diphospho-decaprenol L-rhamnosyltransferase